MWGRKDTREKKKQREQMKAANYNSNKNESSTNIGSTYDLQVVAGKGDKEMAIHHNT